MDTKKRLFRKPVTTISWIAVLTAMALLLGIGANMLHSADSLLSIIDQHHTTIGVQTMEAGLSSTGKYQKISVTLTNSEIAELRALDTVEKVDLRTLTAAYIPELTGQVALMNHGTFCQADIDYFRGEARMNDSYNGVILTGTVVDTEVPDGGWVTEPVPYDCTRIGGTEAMYQMQSYAVVEIDEIVAAHPDYEFFPSEQYTEYSGRINVVLDYYDVTPNAEEATNPLQIGEKYIFCGTYDPMCSGLGFDGFNWPRIQDDVSYPWLTVGGRYQIPGEPIPISGCVLQEDDLVFYQTYDQDMLIWYERGLPVRMYPQNETPIAAVGKLEGSVEELLAENELWAETVAAEQRQLHCLPVLGTEALETMYLFNRNDASILDGRMFSQEEYDAGAKVCIISETAALTGDIQVGDTIHLSQYLCGKKAGDGNTSLPNSYATSSLNNPSAGRIPTREFVTENEEFTVVGIYQLQTSWDNSSFSITPNTVFIPQKAQIDGGYGGASFASFTGAFYNDGYGTSFPNGAYGVYFSVQIKNGQADTFLAQAAQIVPNVFHIFDQGYEAAQQSVRQVAREAWKLIGLAAVGWVLLLMLYVLLYQNKERPNLGILRSVGGSPLEGRRYLFGSGFLLAATGVILGTLFSSAATRMVSKQLAEFMISEGTVQSVSTAMNLGAQTMADILSQASLPFSTLLTLAAAQLAVIAAALWLHAHLTARQTPRKLLSV